jgi:hypothetical protein
MAGLAFIAVAPFRSVRLGQLLYVGDSLAGDDWHERDWSNAVTARARLSDLAASAAMRLDTT